MNPTIDLEEYRCRKCGRLFYVNAAERHTLDRDFGCPYGCDDNGAHVRTVVVEERGEAGSLARIKDRRIAIELSEAEFECSMDRKAAYGHGGGKGIFGPAFLTYVQVG